MGGKFDPDIDENIEEAANQSLEEDEAEKSEEDEAVSFY